MINRELAQGLQEERIAAILLEAHKRFDRWVNEHYGPGETMSFDVATLALKDYGHNRVSAHEYDMALERFIADLLEAGWSVDKVRGKRHQVVSLVIE